MSTPPSGGEGHNPYEQQPPSQSDSGSGDPYRLQPHPPSPYGQQPSTPGSGSTAYGGGQSSQPYPSQPAQPSYGTQPTQPAYGSQPGYGGQPPYSDSAQPTQQFGSPSYGQQPAQPAYGQPGYGQPAYGQQQPPYGQAPYGQYGGQGDWSGAPSGPSKKSRTPLIAGIVALLVVLVVLLLLVLPGSPIGLGKTYFDEIAVADAIADQYEDEFGLPIEVTCPAEREVVSGGSFTCEGTTDEGDEVELDVEITSDDGDYTWSEAA